MPVVSDDWDGLSSFYTEGQEILVVRSTDDVISALELSDAALQRIAVGARERTLAEHTSDHRATVLLNAIERARRPPLQETLAIGQV